ncbi:hypothetical protein B0H13DRAFT_1871783 [Mycena leptocephala]|nr:hypothetical protein B0H13DRAFT_1871783 [Mycena leptocephala]
MPTVLFPRRASGTDAPASRTVVPSARRAFRKEMPTIVINPSRAFRAHAGTPRTSGLIAPGAGRGYGMACTRRVPDGGSRSGAVAALVFRICVVVIISGGRIWWGVCAPQPFRGYQSLNMFPVAIPLRSAPFSGSIPELSTGTGGSDVCTSAGTPTKHLDELQAVERRAAYRLIRLLDGGPFWPPDPRLDVREALDVHSAVCGVV